MKPWGIVSIRISAEDRASIESALVLAADDGVSRSMRRYWRATPSLSDFIRDAALERARRLLQERKTLEPAAARKTIPAAAPATSRKRKTSSRT